MSSETVERLPRRGGVTATNRRILVIDDHRGIHADFRKLLVATAPPASKVLEKTLLGEAEPAGPDFDIDSAYQGDEGVAMVQRALLEARPYALAFVDMRMPPGWDGLETIEQLWRVDLSLQVVICTAYSDSSWQDIQRRFGATDRLLILKKPFDAVEVCQLARTLTEKWRLERQASWRLDELQCMVAEQTGALRQMHDDRHRSSETALFKREEELSRSLALANAVQEAVADGILVLDEHGLIVASNERFVALWRIPPQSVVSGQDQALLEHLVEHLADPEGFLTRARHLHTHPLDVAVDDLLLRDGRTFEYRTGPVQAASGHVYGRLWCFRNVTDQRVRAQELQAALDAAQTANRAKTVFLANMSHELRTPLTAIIGYSELLCEDAEASGHTGAAKDLTRIRKAGHHLRRLVSDVLDLAKIEAGMMSLELVAFDPAWLVRDVLVTARGLTDRNHNVLEWSVPDSLGAMQGDPTRIRQVLLNLLGNAAKFTEGGRVRVDVERETRGDWDRVIFRVSDTGIGIPADKLERIFDDFTQGDDSATRRYGGTGLGLTISRHFCQLMGGNITVESEVGRGTVFTVTLPAARDPASDADAGAAIGTNP